MEKVDGADPDSRDTRNALWEVSGARGYPQMFIRGEDGNHVFVGDYDALELLIEDEAWDSTFEGCAKTE